jgi:putative ABC transport system permease protein
VHIARQITLEAAITGTIGAVCGTALAVIAIGSIARSRDWTATLNPMTTLSAPLIGLLTGALAGIAPALRAAQTPPATTLRG